MSKCAVIPTFRPKVGRANAKAMDQITATVVKPDTLNKFAVAQSKKAYSTLLDKHSEAYKEFGETEHSFEVFAAYASQADQISPEGLESFAEALQANAVEQYQRHLENVFPDSTMPVIMYGAGEAQSGSRISSETRDLYAVAPEASNKEAAPFLANVKSARVIETNDLSVEGRSEALTEALNTEQEDAILVLRDMDSHEGALISLSRGTETYGIGTPEDMARFEEFFTSSKGVGIKPAESASFPKMLEAGFTRAQAKEMFAQTFQDNFFEWFGNWPSIGQYSAVQYSTGEPILVSPANTTATQIEVNSPFVGDKSYGNGMLFKPGNSGELQAGFVKLRNPVTQVNKPLIKARLRQIFGDVVSDEQVDALPDDIKKATNQLESMVRTLEDAAVEYPYTRNHKQNVWELFGYDGIVDGDNYVLFYQFDYWKAWASPEDTISATQETPSEAIKSSSIEDIQIATLAKKFNVRAEWSHEVPDGVIAEVIRDEYGEPVLRVHPERIKKDTIQHEFAHILIDGIGGVTNPLVARGIELLRGTELWAEVQQAYPDLTGNDLAIEVLATAVGREKLASITTNPSLLERIRTWHQALMNRIRQIFDLNNDAIKELAEMTMADVIVAEYDASYVGRVTRQQKEEAQASKRDLQSKNALYTKMMARLDQRLQELGRRTDKHKAAEIRKVKAELRKDMKFAVSFGGIYHYLDYAEQETQAALEQLQSEIKKGTLTAERLTELYEMANTYAEVRDLETFQLTDSVATQYFDADIARLIDIARFNLQRVEAIYMQESREFAVKFLIERARRKRAEIAEGYRIDWRNKFGDQYKNRKKQAQIDRERYVEKRMKAEEFSNQQKIEEDIRDKLRLATQDTGSIQMWITSMKNSYHDEVLQIVAEAVDNAEFKVTQETTRLERQLSELVADLRQEKGNLSDPKKLFEDMLEVDENGKLTQNVVGRHHSKFFELEQAFFENNELLRKKDPTNWHRILEDFYKEHGKISPQFEAYVKQREAQFKKLSKAEFENWKAENHPPQKYIPGDQYLNPQFNKFDPSHKDYLGKDNPIVKFYRFYQIQQSRFDDMIPMAGQKLHNRLPGIRASAMERISGGNLMDTLQNAKDAFQFRLDSTDQTEVELAEGKEKGEIVEDTISVMKDSKGRRISYIPTFYRNKLDLKDQSFDVASLLLMNGHMSMNYYYKNEIHADLQMVGQQLALRETAQHTGGKMQMMRYSKKTPATITGENSKAYRVYQEFMDFRMYGRRTSDSDPFLRHSKRIGQLMSYTGMLLLGGNYVAGIANAALGETLFFSEAVAGQHFGVKEWGKAQEFYTRNLMNGDIAGDIGSDRYDSIVNTMMKHYDTLNTYHPWSHKYSDSNRLMRLFKQHQFYAFNNIGEHKMHNVTLFAILDGINFVDADGNLLDSKGKVVKNEKDAASMLEMYETKDGALKLPEFAKQVVWDGRMYDVGQELDFRITQKTRQINEYLHGAYADQNSNMMQRYALGRMMIMMRKWIEPGFRKRFAGARNVLYNKNELLWDHQLDRFFEGSAVSTYKFLRNAYRENKLMIPALAQHWHMLSDMERQNVHRMAVEMAVGIVSFTFASIMYSLARDMDDDEAANKYWWLGYQANRLNSELMFYYPPMMVGEFQRVLKSPAATISILERSYRLINQIPNFGEQYQSGRRKGEYKIGKYAMDMVPFYGPIQRKNTMADLVNIVYNR